MKPSWIDRSPLPMGILHSGRFVYVNRAFLKLIGASWVDIDGRPFLERVAAEDRRRVADRYERRLLGQPVPDTYEIQVLRMDGTRRTVEVWAAAIGEGESMFQLADRTGRTRHQERLGALARLGVAVQVERSEEAVFEGTARGLLETGAATVRLARAGDTMRIVSIRAPGDLEDRVRDALGRVPSIGGVGGEGTREAWETGGMYFDDMPLSILRFFGGEPSREARAAADLVRQHGLQRGVLLRIDVEGKPRELLLVLSDWFLPEDMPACRLFAAQVSAAIDAARALRAEQGRNAALTAQTRIAAFARASSDLDALFDLGAAELASVLGCHVVGIHLVDEARGEAKLVHLRGGSEEARVALATVSLVGTDIGRVAREGIPHVVVGPSNRGFSILRDATHSGAVVVIPLSTRGRVIGAMSAAYTTEQVTPADVELMEAAGAHFAAAIEAQRLFSDLRQSYADLAHAQAQLVQRERLAAIGELAAVVAHEVRNPLGVLFNSFGAFRKLLGVVEGSADTLLGIMEEEAMRLNHIVGDLLDFARPIAPSLSRENLRIIVDEAVEAALTDFLIGGGVSGQDIALEREVEALPAVPMDARLVRQAILNIAMNAVHAMPEGGRMRVRVSKDEVNGVAMAKVAIEDTGPGIPKEIAARVFEPFFTTRATGTGLGLAVVKRIVDSHHGKLELSSVEGSGTTFALWLPLEDATV